MKFEVSKAKNKKYSVVTPSGKKINFGDSRYEHYKDSTGVGAWSKLDHNDKERRKQYRTRHEKVMTKEGIPAYKDKEQASYYAYHYLW